MKRTYVIFLDFFVNFINSFTWYIHNESIYTWYIPQTLSPLHLWSEENTTAQLLPFKSRFAARRLWETEFAPSYSLRPKYLSHFIIYINFNYLFY
jgi:hypothetical protein